MHLVVGSSVALLWSGFVLWWAIRAARQCVFAFVGSVAGLMWFDAGPLWFLAYCGAVARGHFEAVLLLFGACVPKTLLAVGEQTPCHLWHILALVLGVISGPLVVLLALACLVRLPALVPGS